MEKLVALLPAQYVMSTTLHDRLVHLQLLKRLRAQPELQVLSTWTQYTDRIGTEGLRQHLIFRDRPGSLGAVTDVLSKVLSTSATPTYGLLPHATPAATACDPAGHRMHPSCNPYACRWASTSSRLQYSARPTVRLQPLPLRVAASAT